MKKYQIIIRFEDTEMEVEVEAENWGQVCEKILGRIEIIDRNEKENELA